MSADGKDIDVDDDTGELLMIVDYQLVAMIGYERGNRRGLKLIDIIESVKKIKNEKKKIPLPRTLYVTPIER